MGRMNEEEEKDLDELLAALAERAGAEIKVVGEDGVFKASAKSDRLKFSASFGSKREAALALLALACSGREEETGGLAGSWRSPEEAKVRLSAEGLLPLRPKPVPENFWKRLRRRLTFRKGAL